MANEEVKCGNCKYCHELKELKDKEWIIRSVCTYYPQTEKYSGYNNAFAVVVELDDYCECFTVRSDEAIVLNLQ